MRVDQIALQLYTVRELAATDLRGTLEAVAGVGYRAVEVAGLPETPPHELATLLQDNGLRVIASHESIESLRRDADGVADRLAAIDCPRIVVPWMPEADRRTGDDVRRYAGELGAFASRFAARGIRLGYHDHAFEFEPLDSSTIWQILLAELPAEVELEIDVYWAAIGGQDPVELLQATAGRVRLLHMKDRDTGPGRPDAPVGDGDLAFPAIVAAGRAAGVEWYIVEQDHPTDALGDIARSLAALRSLAAGVGD